MTCIYCGKDHSNESCRDPKKAQIMTSLYGGKSPEVNTNQWDELWDADPNCVHDIQPQSGGGVRCVKCQGWCCL